MRILIFGAGFLGTRLGRDLPGAQVSTVDITDAEAVSRVLSEVHPDAVINAAGKTGRPNVDWCETHPHATFRANVVGAVTLAERCAAHRVYLLHLGSGCVFYGPSPTPGGWREDDFANPISTYARSKYAADLALSQLPDVAIVRPRMPIDVTPGPRNLLTKLAGYSHVVDATNSVTLVPDLVRVVAQLIERRATGIFHATNPGQVGHRQLLELYRRYVDPQHTCTWVTADALLESGRVTRERSECILADTRLATRGIAMPPAAEGIEALVRGYGRG